MQFIGRHFLHTANAVTETLDQAIEDSIHLRSVIFCDAIVPSETSDELAQIEMKTLSKLVERFFRDYFDRAQAPDFCENTLRKAFEYANEQLVRYAKHRQKEFAVSATVLLASPPSHDNEGIVLAGSAGDSQLFAIDSVGAHPLLHDNLNEDLAPALNPAERYSALKNGLGLSEEIDVSTTELTCTELQRLVIVSYGLKGALAYEAIQRLGLAPLDKQSGAQVALEALSESSNLLQLKTVSVEAESSASPSGTERTPSSVNNVSNRRYLAITLGAAAAAVALPLLTLKLSEPSGGRANAAIERHVALAEARSESLEAKVSAQAELIADLEQELLSSVEESTTLQKRLDTLLQGSDDLVVQELLQDLEEQETLAATLRSSLAYERTQREVLQAHLKELEEEKLMLAETQRKVSQKEAELANLGENQLELRAERDTLQNKIQEMEQQIASLKARGEAWHDREDLLAGYAEENAQLLEGLTQKTDELRALEDQVAELRSNSMILPQLEEEIVRNRDEVERLERLLTMRDEKVAFLEQNLLLLDDMKRQLDDKDAMAQRLGQRNQSTLAQLEEANSQIAFMQDSIEMMGSLKNEISEREDQVLFLKGEVSRLTEAQADSAQQSATIDSLRNRVTQLKATVETLDEIIASQEEAHQSELVELSHEVDTLREQVAQQSVEGEDSARLERALYEAESRIATLESLKAASEAEAARRSTQNDADSALEHALAEAESRIEQLENLNAASEAEAAQQQKSLVQLSERVQEAQEARTQWEQARQTLAAALREKDQQLQALQASGDRDSSAYLDLQSRHSSLEQLWQGSELERQDLQAKVDEQNALIDKLQRLQEGKSSERDALLVELEELRHNNTELHAQLAQREERLAQLRDEHSSALEVLALSEGMDDSDRLRAELAELESSVLSYQEENSQLTTRLAQQSSQIDRLQNLAAEVETVRSAFNEELQRSRDLLFASRASQSALEEAKSEIAELKDRQRAQDALADEVARLETRSQLAEKDLAAAQEAVQRFERHNQSLEQERQGMLERLAKAEDQVANLAAEREEFTRSTAQIKELQAQWKQEREGLLARVRLEEEERAQLMQDYADLSERASDLAKYRERYHAEHDLRIQKERRFAALAKRLQEQRYALEMIERTKQQALEELHHNKQSVTESPHTIGDAVDSSTEEFAYRQPTSRQARTHIVDSGDTLSGISLKYYGTTSRWADIFEANRDKLPSSDRVTAGVELVIPD